MVVFCGERGKSDIQAALESVIGALGYLHATQCVDAVGQRAMSSELMCPTAHYRRGWDGKKIIFPFSGKDTQR